MPKTSEVQLRAIRKYDARREKRTISFRLSPEDMALLDARRGEKSRGAIAEELMLRWLRS